MVRPMSRALVLLILAATAGPARAQDDVALRAAYAAAEVGVRAQYEALLAQMAQAPGQPPSGWADKTKALMKMLSYNQAATFAFCVAAAERDHSPNAPRVPSSENLVLRTCVEIKMAQLNKFSERVGYAELFFPERIARCGEGSRLRDQEKVLKPYDFLLLDEPKLYDFERYNECLMKQQ
jgi:hypothetical protein